MNATQLKVKTGVRKDRSVDPVTAWGEVEGEEEGEEVEEGKEVEAEVAAAAEEEVAVEMTTTGARAAAGKTSMVASDLRCEASSVPHGREARCCVTACHMASMGQPDTWGMGHAWGWCAGAACYMGPEACMGWACGSGTCSRMGKYMLLHEAVHVDA